MPNDISLPNWNITTDDTLLLNWPVKDVLLRLADAATHLLSDHDCDAHGYEELQHAVVAARAHAATERQPRIKEALLDEILDCDKCDLCEDHHANS